MGQIFDFRDSLRHIELGEPSDIEVVTGNIPIEKLVKQILDTPIGELKRQYGSSGDLFEAIALHCDVLRRTKAEETDGNTEPHYDNEIIYLEEYLKNREI